MPYLVQSWVSSYGNRNDNADELIITPPLFRLDAKGQNILRIIATNVKNLPSDKESLFLLNVKAIPAKSFEQSSRVNTSSVRPRHAKNNQTIPEAIKVSIAGRNEQAHPYLF